MLYELTQPESANIAQLVIDPTDGRALLCSATAKRLSDTLESEFSSSYLGEHNCGVGKWYRMRDAAGTPRFDREAEQYDALWAIVTAISAAGKLTRLDVDDLDSHLSSSDTGDSLTVRLGEILEMTFSSPLAAGDLYGETKRIFFDTDAGWWKHSAEALPEYWTVDQMIAVVTDSILFSEIQQMWIGKKRLPEFVRFRPSGAM